jgi:hypothetical protein
VASASLHQTSIDVTKGAAMTIIVDDRTKFDEALAKPRLTLLVLSGSEATAARAIHDVTEAKITEPGRKVFWITDFDLLSDDELGGVDERLFARGGRYAIVGRCKAAGGAVQRVVVVRGYHSALLKPNGMPDVFSIRAAYNEGEAPRQCAP